MKKRVLGLGLALVMLLSLVPSTAFAVETVASGTCGAEGDGSNLTWTLDDEGTLTISGTGAMEDYIIRNESATEHTTWVIGKPWDDYTSTIKRIYICDGVTSIEGTAFQYCNNLTELTISKDVKYIGESAFANCGSLTSVAIPDSVTSIGSFAFEYCSSLASVTIGNGVTSIDYGAFYGCSNLTKVTIPKNVTSFGGYVFGSCEKLTSAGPIGSGCNCEFGWVEMIPNNVFEGCSGLTSVTIPDSVANIGNYAFRECENLTNMTIGNSVTSIGSNVFYGCSSLTDVYYNSSGMLWYCILIDYGNDTLDNVNMHYAEPTGRTVVNGTCGAEGDGSNLTWTLDDEGTLIVSGEGAMEDYDWESPWWTYCTAIKSVTINNGVTSIGDYAFENCSGLTSVTIPDGVTSIGGCAFRGCSSLTSVTIGNGVTSIGDYAFENCSGLTSVTIPDSVTSIGWYAFNGCNSLTDVYYNSTDIAWQCISIDYGNDALNNVNMHYAEPSGRIVVSGTCGAEGDGSNLTWTLDDVGTLTVNGLGAMLDNVDSIPWNKCRTAIKTVVIGSGVTGIAEYAFDGCSSLASVTIPDSVTSIGWYAFNGCNSLTDVYYNSTDIAWQCISIGCGIDAINNVNMYYAEPTGRIAISGTCGAEGDGSNLKWTLDDTGILTISGTGAMEDYRDDHAAPWNNYQSVIKSVIINNSVTSIGESAFSWCSNLISVTIGNGVTSIGDRTFWGCDSIKSVIVPSSVKSIGEDAFVGCDNLTDIYYAGTETEWELLQTYTTTLTTVHYTVPVTGRIIRDGKCGDNLTWTLDDSGKLDIIGEGEMEDYVSSGNPLPWEPYRQSIKTIVIEDGVTSISKRAFEEYRSLTSVTLPDSIESIDDSAFRDCYDLTGITIPSSVTSIGNRAFSSCYKLRDIHYNAKAVSALTEDSSVFFGAGKEGNGIHVIFGEKVKKIPAYLFGIESTWYSADYTPNIVEIVFTGNVPAIGANAFSGIKSSTYYPYGDSTWTSKIMKNYGGTLTWKPYSTAKVVSCQCTGKTSYIVGDKLNTSGISVTINRADGCVETYNCATGKISLGAYDMSKIGPQTIDVTCKDVVGNTVTTTLNIYVHDKQVKTMAAKDYPESSHNYEDNLDKTYTYKVPNGLSMDVAFSEKTAVEANVDYIYVNGARYTGTALAGKTVSVEGDTLTIRLVTDSGDNDYGFSIDQIEATSVVHEYTATKTVAPTCTNKGYTAHTCVCGESYKDNYVNAKGHTTKATTTKATLSANGKIVYKCSVCGAATQSTKTIYMPKTFSLSYTKTTYNGKVKTPTVTVKDSKGNVLKKGTDYTVTYASGRKAVGTYKVTIKGIGKYSFTKTLTFKINPAATKIVSATNVATKSIKVKWNKAAGAGGYQVKLMNGSTTVKTIKVSGASTLTKTLTKLTKGSTYKIYVRSYKTVNSTNYYSAWSAYKSVKVAK